MEPRYYQTEAVEAAYQHLFSESDNPAIVLPTGAGKTLVIATICRDTVQQWNGRVLVLSHVKELLEQTAGTLAAICPDIAVGVHSAGLKRRDTDEPVIVAGIQSAYRKPQALGAFDLVLVDEAHLIPLSGEGMYRTLLTALLELNPKTRVIGLTATPYRTTTGLICQPEHFLNRVCYDVPVEDLIDRGYLSRLRGKSAVNAADLSGVHVRGGEFIADEMEQAFNGDNQLVSDAVSELITLADGRHSVLIFAAGVMHGMSITYEIEYQHGEPAGFICGETPDEERAALLARFRDGSLRWLINVNVLTTGFDAPNVDCIALLRATLSTGLYVQMVGRGLRLHESKTDCLILDYGNNIERHGPIDAIDPSARGDGSGSGDGTTPIRVCPDCREVVPAGCRRCVHCDFAFPPPEITHEVEASEAAIISPEVTFEVYDIESVTYAEHTKKGADDTAPKTLRVDYHTTDPDVKFPVSEWVCVEHTGYARTKAERWWQDRIRQECPETAQEAAAIGTRGYLREPKRITVKTTEGEKYDRITDYELGPLPDAESILTDEELPF